ERPLPGADDPFDRTLRGDDGPLAASAKLGYRLCTGKARCVKCHDGPQLTDDGFHNIGLPGSDEGRFKIIPVVAMRGAFKTPGLRGVALTAPYFHDGSAGTLGDVVEHYDRGGTSKESLDPEIVPLHLTAEEKAALV